MKLRKNKENKIESEDFLKEASKCSPNGLKELLKRIEAEIAICQGKDGDLIIAKTIITSRLASMRDSGKIPL